MSTPHILSEAAVTLIINSIKANIATALASVRGYYHDGAVTTEVPPTTSYFIYPKAHGYACPAIFVIDDTTDFRQSEKLANFIDAKMSINVSVKIEDIDQTSLTVKGWRYVSALHSILEQSSLVSADSTIKLTIKVKRVKPGDMYVLGNAEADSTATFFKEYTLYCDVEFFESF
jgi:hypothetical protein